MLGVRLLLSPFLLLLLPGVMPAVKTAGGSAEKTVMAGIMSGNAADHRALHAAFGLGAIRRKGERGNDEQSDDDLHGGASFEIRVGNSSHCSDNPATRGRVPPSGVVARLDRAIR